MPKKGKTIPKKTVKPPPINDRAGDGSLGAAYPPGRKPKKE